MSAVDYRHERYVTNEGYAVGEFVGSEQYLTILGSYWETIPLFATPAKAEDWHAQRYEQEIGDWFKPVTIKVRRCGQSIFEVGWTVEDVLDELAKATQ